MEAFYCILIPNGWYASMTVPMKVAPLQSRGFMIPGEPCSIVVYCGTLYSFTFPFKKSVCLYLADTHLCFFFCPGCCSYPLRSLRQHSLQTEILPLEPRCSNAEYGKKNTNHFILPRVVLFCYQIQIT